jgi:hypothetical protein
LKSLLNQTRQFLDKERVPVWSFHLWKLQIDCVFKGFSFLSGEGFFKVHNLLQSSCLKIPFSSLSLFCFPFQKKFAGFPFCSLFPSYAYLFSQGLWFSFSWANQHHAWNFLILPSCHILKFKFSMLIRKTQPWCWLGLWNCTLKASVVCQTHLAYDKSLQYKVYLLKPT